MIPLGDDNPLHPGQRQYITIALIAACILAFLYQLGQPPATAQFFAFMYGLVPSALTGQPGIVPPELLKHLGTDALPAPAIDPYLTIFTSMFLHGGFMHLAGNMLYLWIFGDNVELAMGHKRFIVFYLLCGVVAALTQVATSPASAIPMVGASGAISGVLGAYFLLFPKANVRLYMMLGPFMFWRMIYVPAWIVLGGWFAMQLLSGMMPSGGVGGVAFWAHAGGFVAGLVLVKFFIRKQEHLFHSPETSAWTIAKRDALPPRRVLKPGQGPWDRG